MPEERTSFEALMAAAREGCEEAKGELLRRLMPLLRRKVKNLPDRGLCSKFGDSDFLQDTFTAAVEKFPEFRGRAEQEFVCWLMTILMNQVRDVNKKFG